ncbi:MAG: rod shape-determining protein MreD, partial [Flavobacteriaceae bacterium]|nr:rod shape-determining protein MreD [Flavobacteriaceae bacterium]
MSSIPSIFIARSFLLLILQILVFNKVVVFEEVTAFVYLYSIIYLPITLKKHQLLLIAFFLGLLVDIFAQTGAMHAFAAVFLAYFRNFLFRVGTG